MTEERTRILKMMSDGKLSVAETEALLDALGQGRTGHPPRTPSAAEAAPTAQTPKYLRVLVEGEDEGKPNKVNVRVPLDLIRAGMRLAALLPAAAYEPVNKALRDSGVHVDLSKLKADELEGLVAHLQELHVDVDSGTETVRVYCE